MQPQSTPQSVIDAFGASDLSCLVALDVLLRRSDDHGWMPLDEFLMKVREAYAALASDPGNLLSDVAPPWEQTAGPHPGVDEYLYDHVVRRLEAQEILVLSAAGTDPEMPAGVQLVTVLLPDRMLLAEQVRGRIHGLLSAYSLGPESPVGRAEPAVEPAVEQPRVPGTTLSARGLVKIYRKRRVVNDVELGVSQGEIVGLLGPNGAGKTTTFYMMVGLIAPDVGDVFLGGRKVTSVPMYKRARMGVGYLSQEPSVFRKLSVEENILAILQMQDLPRREQKKRLEELLDELGIKHLRKSKAYALSGGERRRLEITRALVGRPKFMLLDEPFAGVDPIAVHDIQQIVSDLKRRNIGVLISDHNVEQTLDIVDRAYIMYDGRVRVSGTVSELVWNDEVAEIYLGPTLTARMRQRYTYPE